MLFYGIWPDDLIIGNKHDTHIDTHSFLENQ